MYVVRDATGWVSDVVTNVANEAVRSIAAVSPIARPVASITPEEIDGADDGRIKDLMVCHLVSPKA